MSSDNLDLATKIADLVIDKSYWSNEWFLGCSILFVGLIAAVSAWGGSYLSTRAHNKALRTDFEELLSQVKRQAQAVKKIEEDIAHDFWEKKESLKIKREKLEEAYQALGYEVSEIVNNLARALVAEELNGVSPVEKVRTIVSLYFYDEMSAVLAAYVDARNNCLIFQTSILKENVEINDQQESIRIHLNKKSQVNHLTAKLGAAKAEIEKALQDQMKKLANSPMNIG